MALIHEAADVESVQNRRPPKAKGVILQSKP